jgi:ketosteroid isomerase-like protein
VTDADPRTVFERYLRATNARDAVALTELVHPDFEDVYPQSGERTRGAANLQAIIEHYPGGGYVGSGLERIVGTEDRWVMTPAFSVLRIEGAGDTFTGVSRGRYPDGTEWFIVTIGQMRDGKVWRAETYFAETFEPPAWRSSWVERAPSSESGSPSSG